MLIGIRVAPMKLLDWVLVALLAASLILVMELFKHVYARLYGAED